MPALPRPRSRPLTRRTLIGAALAAGAAATLRPSGHAIAAGGIYLGVFQPGAPADLTGLTVWERDAGKQAAVVMWYQDWASGVLPDRSALGRLASRGSVPLITWEPWRAGAGVIQAEFSLAAIGGGGHDAYVDRYARQLAAHGGPVLLRWAHEMNGTWYPWGRGVNGNTPEHYRAAWSRLRGIFAAAGAANVQWVWSPNIVYDAASRFEPYFPGESSVEWLGLDGYNWGSAAGRGGKTGWQSFGQVFGESYGRIAALSARPLMIAETASAEGTGGRKADWIADAMSAQLPAIFPRVHAFVWFNERKERDWPIQSSTTARRAFARAAASPTYLGRWS